MFGDLQRLADLFYTNKKLVIYLSSFTVISIFVFAYTLYRTQAWGDDLWFAQHVREYSLSGWLSYRWEVWSSRLFPESMLWILSPASRNFWIILSVLFYFFYIVILYRIFILFINTSNTKIQYKVIAYVFICISIWLMSLTTLKDAVLWLTGSINYFWVGVLFLGALYTPLHILIRERMPHMAAVIASMTLTLIVGLSHEQFGLSLVVLSTLIFFCMTIKSYSDSRHIISRSTLALAMFSVAAVISLIFSLAAPGNTSRLESETASWQPDINTVPLGLRIESDIRWFFESAINNTGLLFILLSVVLVYLLYKQKRTLFASILTVFALLLFVSKLLGSNLAFDIFKPLHTLFQFNATWGYQGGLVSFIPLIVWGLFFVTIIYTTTLVLWHKKSILVLSLGLLVTSAGVLAALWLSPTMYVSGYRVVYASWLMTTVLTLILFAQTIPVIKKSRRKS